MKTRKLFALLLTVVLLFSMAACSAGSASSDGVFDRIENGQLGESADLTGTGTTETAALPTSQKLIRKVWLDAETEDMDSLLASVEERIAQLGGYVEAREVQNGSVYSGKSYRYANLTIRIPADKLDGFVDNISDVSNITSNRETTEDVTLSYVEYESKIVALETEQARLLELLAQAKTMEDILRIETRMTEIRRQLELAKSQIRLYDNLVDYSTVYLDITEVTEYTPTEEPETMWERMGAGIRDSWNGMVSMLENLLVLLVVILPYLLPLAVIGVVVFGIIFIKRRKRRKQIRKEETAE